MFLCKPRKKSGSQLTSNSAVLPWVTSAPSRVLARLPDDDPVNVTLGKRLPLADRRFARACSIFDSEARRSRFDFSARSSSEVSIGSLNTVHHCERAASSTGPRTSPLARGVFHL